MALRLRNGPTFSKTYAHIGERVVVSMKVENTSAAPARVRLAAEDLVEGGLAKPVDFVLSFEPEAATVKPKGQARVEFAWTAAVPEGKELFTFRGKLVLRDADTAAIVHAQPLDFHVARAE